MASKKKLKPTVIKSQASLVGWSAVFAEQSEQSVEREQKRKKQAIEVIDSARNLELKLRMQVIFIAFGGGILNNREFFEEAHRALDLPRPQ